VACGNRGAVLYMRSGGLRASPRRKPGRRPDAGSYLTLKLPAGLGRVRLSTVAGELMAVTMGLRSGLSHTKGK